MMKMMRVTNRITRLMNRRFSTTIEETMKNLLINELNATSVAVEDVSGGCGAAYNVLVESPKFVGKNMVAQHRMVTTILKEQIKDMHSITIRTKLSPQS